MQAFRPHASWRSWFNEAFEQAILSTMPEEQLKGWHKAAAILGDMNACVLCLFACLHARSLGGADFQVHIDLCLLDMGLAVPTAPAGNGAVRAKDLGKPEAFRRDTDALEVWMSEQLKPFGGNPRLAAEFGMRLTAIRLGLLIGPNAPSIEQVLDVSLWTASEPPREHPAPASMSKKRWWRFWT